MELPPLRALHCFEAVTRLNSFSDAATSLNVTQSAVSHQIRLLEEYLGESLFNRQGRNFEITQKGQRYYEEVSNALNHIFDASEQIKHKHSNKLRLAIYSSLAIKWLMPHLDEFRQAYPDINLVLNMVTEDPIISDNTADCFITLNAPSRHFETCYLYSEKLTLVCGKSLYNDIKNITLEQALQRYPLLSVNYDKHAKDDCRDWHKWSEQTRTSLPKHARYQHFSHVLLAAEAARYNLGIGLIDEMIISEAELQANLVRLDASQAFTGAKFYYVYRASRADNKAYVQLGAWLKSKCAFAR
ncbi:LysR substrate-binding domain-containing protein [Aliiglaciecola lipolytica]|uniref:LysR family transcriptional regulator n=1 Tax=Aliiglaciecola lipolytica E3 TaxID=1127673 RepID=K6X036_9ALTE|nr:LysR substrate-binding domain-containing protein [Aliiglaciecola lipolytica]GAC14034.1 LysR family transcriptional regulator [Aliiglaciecola lipolytica E3]